MKLLLEHQVAIKDILPIADDTVIEEVTLPDYGEFSCIRVKHYQVTGGSMQPTAGTIGAATTSVWTALAGKLLTTLGTGMLLDMVGDVIQPRGVDFINTTDGVTIYGVIARQDAAPVEDSEAIRKLYCIVSQLAVDPALAATPYWFRITYDVYQADQKEYLTILQGCC